MDAALCQIHNSLLICYHIPNSFTSALTTESRPPPPGRPSPRKCEKHISSEKTAQNAPGRPRRDMRREFRALCHPIRIVFRATFRTVPPIPDPLTCAT
jgi:hypothetical protein